MMKERKNSLRWCASCRGILFQSKKEDIVNEQKENWQGNIQTHIKIPSNLLLVVARPMVVNIAE